MTVLTVDNNDEAMAVVDMLYHCLRQDQVAIVTASTYRNSKQPLNHYESNVSRDVDNVKLITKRGGKIIARPINKCAFWDVDIVVLVHQASVPKEYLKILRIEE